MTLCRSFQLAFLVFLSSPLFLFAQTDMTQGIHFEKDLNWQQVQAKAKAENKYIFVDCFAAWCGPCKMMEEDVYPKKEVADYFNVHFISVKLQMDRTAYDDAHIKSWYETAKDIEKSYQINAYPTYLFLDPYGNAVHKAKGAVSADKFIGIGQNALDSQRQYYTIVKKYYTGTKNFEPGKIDIAELKGLARTFQSSDRSTAGKMATDYLNRIPKKQLHNEDNLLLMTEFADDSAVLKIARRYVKGLDKTQLSQESNLQFMRDLWADSIIHFIAKKYILSQREKELYANKQMISFLLRFTDTLTDPGFAVFYNHSAAVDRIMDHPHYGHDVSEGLISKTEFDPTFDSCKQSGIVPGFSVIHTRVTKKYGKTYADDVVVDGKLDWYKWLIRTKKENQYWPQFLIARVAFIQHYRFDTLIDKSHLSTINAWCYNEFFVHSDDSIQLQLAANWMKWVTDHLPEIFSVRDTYACVLYKEGKTNQAIEQEEIALDIATKSDSKSSMQRARFVIEKMKGGEKIWLQKNIIEG